MIAVKEDNQQTDQIAVRVLFFGAARDAVGHSEAALTLTGPVNGASAFEQVLAQFPSLRRFGRSLLFAINEEYAPADREVHEGDELAVFPPVSGGAVRDGEMGISGDPATEGLAETSDRQANFSASDFFTSAF